MLIATDILAVSSSSNILNAPASSFAEVSVTSQNYGLHYPARGQREWQEEYWHLVTQVDALYDSINAVQSVENTLSTHTYTAVVEGHMTAVTGKEMGAYGWAPGYIMAARPLENGQYNDNATTAGGSNACAAFRVTAPFVLTRWTVTLASAGHTMAIEDPAHNATVVKLSYFNSPSGGASAATKYAEGSVDITVGATTHQHNADIAYATDISQMTLMAGDWYTAAGKEVGCRPVSNSVVGTDTIAVPDGGSSDVILLVFVTQAPRYPARAPMTITLEANRPVTQV
jgi:hypothetical protein